MKCPHCDNRLELSMFEKSHRHAENYGSSFSDYMCPICANMFRIYTKRTVSISGKPEKMPKDTPESFTYNPDK